jgi:hypothetical protein
MTLSTRVVAANSSIEITQSEYAYQEWPHPADTASPQSLSTQPESREKKRAWLYNGQFRNRRVIFILFKPLWKLVNIFMFVMGIGLVI